MTLSPQANGLVNSLIELQRIGSVGLVVVDEVGTPPPPHTHTHTY